MWSEFIANKKVMMFAIRWSAAKGHCFFTRKVQGMSYLYSDETCGVNGIKHEAQTI
jgi:hypothetical protein